MAESDASMTTTPVALPPPPDPKETAPVTSVDPTNRETVMGGIRHILSNVAGRDYAQTGIGQAIQQHQAQRLADAQMNQKNANVFAAALGAGEIGPDGQPTGMIPDPQTGQERPMTPQERQFYLGRWQKAHEDYTKAAGVDKDTKAHAQKQGQIHQLLITKGHKALRALAAIGGGGGQDAQGAPGAQGGMTPPPSPGGADGASAAPTVPGANAMPSAPPAGMPPPPQPTSPAQGAMSMSAGQMAEGQGLASKVKESQASFEQRKRQADEIGLTGQDRSEFIATGKMPTIPRVTTGTYTDPSSGKSFTGAPDPATGKIMDVDTQAVVPGAVKETAGMQAAPSVKTTNGVPTAISRNGKLLTPDSPDWTLADERQFKAAKAAYAQGNLDKMKLNQDRMNSYINARAKTQQYGVINKETGEPEMVNALTLNANPGKYGPGALTQQLKNRAGVFDEIDATKEQFNNALGKLSDDDFKTLPRAQIALALQDRDPRSALSTFLGSEVGTTLTPAQVDYITGLMTMDESAMSLRSIAGMGQGSDTLRNAITRMLPGPETPSKDYAKRQMDLFKVELDALRRAVPASGKLGMSPPPSPGGGKEIHYKIVNGELVPQ